MTGYHKLLTQTHEHTNTRTQEMSSAKWQTVNGVRYSTGLCQSHTEGIKDCDGPEYTRRSPNNDKVSRAIALVRATAEEVAGCQLSSGTKTIISGPQDPVVNEGEKETFVHEGKVWETVKELTIEEAITLQRNSSEVARGIS